MVAVDQLEELFTLCELEEERAAFLDWLVAAAGDPERRALVVVALRADFYGRLAGYPRFAELLSGSHALVGADGSRGASAGDRAAGRSCGTGGRARVGRCVGVRRRGEPGGLPLLSTTLLELWRVRDGRILRYESYLTSGGVRGAVARLAEAAYTGLDEGERRVARGVMLRLASGEEGALVRRRVPLVELERIDRAEPVLAALTDARLLTVSDGEVELSHEALLREWPRYRGWLEEDRAGRRLHAHLTAAQASGTRQSRPGRAVPRRKARGRAGLGRAARRSAERAGARVHPSSRLEAERSASAALPEPPASQPPARGRRAAGVRGGCRDRRAGQAAERQTSGQPGDDAARVALARQLGAQAVNEPRLDRAMLLAREAVSLDRSPQTEGTLLATLQRSPAVIGTFALPIDLPRSWR